MGKPKPREGVRSLFLPVEITERSFERFFAELGQMIVEPGPITLLINSRGGELMSGFAFHDAILAARQAGSPVAGYVFGRVASMATVVFQACEARLMAPNSWLHVHSMRWGMDGEPFERHREELRENDVLEKQCYRILARRSIYTPAQLRTRVEGHEYVLQAREAVAEGLADAVVRLPVPRRSRGA